MQFSYFVFSLFFTIVFVSGSFGGNNYIWGEIGKDDYFVARNTVKKTFVVGLVVTEKYVFKQMDNLNAVTITAIKVTDKMKTDGATAELVNGGPGSKGATILFKSRRGHGIKSVVEIFGY